MYCDYYLYLLIKTTKEGVATVAAASDSEPDIEDAFLRLTKIYSEEIKKGELRFNIYKEF